MARSASKKKPATTLGAFAHLFVPPPAKASPKTPPPKAAPAKTKPKVAKPATTFGALAHLFAPAPKAAPPPKAAKPTPPVKAPPPRPTTTFGALAHLFAPPPIAPTGPLPGDAAERAAIVRFLDERIASRPMGPSMAHASAALATVLKKIEKQTTPDARKAALAVLREMATEPAYKGKPRMALYRAAEDIAAGLHLRAPSVRVLAPPPPIEAAPPTQRVPVSMYAPVQTIVVAQVVREGGEDVPEAAVWKQSGTAEDLRAAQAFATANNRRVFAYPVSEPDPIGRAKRDMLATGLRAPPSVRPPSVSVPSVRVPSVRIPPPPSVRPPSMKAPAVVVPRPAGPVVMFVFDDGTEVLAIKGRPEEQPIARSYTSPTLAQQRLAEQGEGWDLIKRGRRWYIHKIGTGPAAGAKPPSAKAVKPPSVKPPPMPAPVKPVIGARALPEVAVGMRIRFKGDHDNDAGDGTIEAVSESFFTAKMDDGRLLQTQPLALLGTPRWSVLPKSAAAQAVDRADELFDMQQLLRKAGFADSGPAAKRLQSEGMGPEELRGRIANEPGAIGSLEVTHGLTGRNAAKSGVDRLYEQYQHRLATLRHIPGVAALDDRDALLDHVEEPWEKFFARVRKAAGSEAGVEINGRSLDDVAREAFKKGSEYIRARSQPPYFGPATPSVPEAPPVPSRRAAPVSEAKPSPLPKPERVRPAPKPKPRTFAQARDALLAEFRERGWTVNAALKVPHATNPATGDRLWFKAQAIYLGHGTSFAGAHSISSDMRAETIDELLADVERYKAAAAPVPAPAPEMPRLDLQAEREITAIRSYLQRLARGERWFEKPHEVVHDKQAKDKLEAAALNIAMRLSESGRGHGAPPWWAGTWPPPVVDFPTFAAETLRALYVEDNPLPNVRKVMERAALALAERKYAKGQVSAVAPLPMREETREEAERIEEELERLRVLHPSKKANPIRQAIRDAIRKVRDVCDTEGVDWREVADCNDARDALKRAIEARDFAMKHGDPNADLFAGFKKPANVAAAEKVIEEIEALSKRLETHPPAEPVASLEEHVPEPEPEPAKAMVHMHDGELYVDSDFVNAVQRVPGFSLHHIGFGEFDILTPHGKVGLIRYDDQVNWPGKTGRAHKMAGPPAAIAAVRDGMHVDELLQEAKGGYEQRASSHAQPTPPPASIRRSNTPFDVTIETSPTAADEDAIDVGTVVHYKGRTRRYVVVDAEEVGRHRLMMRALSGAEAGSGPSGVPVEDVELDADQTIAFIGPNAAKFKRKYESYLQQFGKRWRPEAAAPAGAPAAPPSVRFVHVPVHEANNTLYVDTEFRAWLGKRYGHEAPGWGGSGFMIEGPFGQITGEGPLRNTQWPGMMGVAYALKTTGYAPREGDKIMAAFRADARIDDFLRAARDGHDPLIRIGKLDLPEAAAAKPAPKHAGSPMYAPLLELLGDEGLADEAVAIIDQTAKPGWRDEPIKTRRIFNALNLTLHENQELTTKAMEIAKRYGPGAEEARAVPAPSPLRIPSPGGAPAVRMPSPGGVRIPTPAPSAPHARPPEQIPIVNYLYALAMEEPEHAEAINNVADIIGSWEDVSAEEFREHAIEYLRETAGNLAPHDPSHPLNKAATAVERGTYGKPEPRVEEGEEAPPSAEKPERGTTAEEAKEVAKTILEQIPTPVKMELGVVQRIAVTDKMGGVELRLGGAVETRGKRVRIVLNFRDTYDVEVYRIVRGKKKKVLGTAEDVYFDSLEEVLLRLVFPKDATQEALESGADSLPEGEPTRGVQAPEEAEAQPMPTAPLTVKIRSGDVVLAKLYKGEPSATTFANRTQADKAQARLGEGWEVIQRGRPWFVRQVSGGAVPEPQAEEGEITIKIPIGGGKTQKHRVKVLARDRDLVAHPAIGAPGLVGLTYEPTSGSLGHYTSVPEAMAFAMDLNRPEIRPLFDAVASFPPGSAEQAQAGATLNETMMASQEGRMDRYYAAKAAESARAEEHEGMPPSGPRPSRRAGAAAAVLPPPAIEAAIEAGPLPATAAMDLEREYDEGTPEELQKKKERIEANLKAMWLAFEINQNPRQPTNDELLLMGAYSGWGGLGDREETKGEWKKIVARMPPEFQAEERGLIHEFYTKAIICQEVGRALKPYFPVLADLNQGTIETLEPSAGIGRFVRTMEGPGFEQLHWHAVEYSKVSAALLHAMRPHLDLFQGSFEKWVTQHEDTWRGRFHLVVSNPPYGARGVARSEDDNREYFDETESWPYFLRRGLDLLAKGGIGVFLIPSGFMSGKGKENKAVRGKVLLRHHLMAAFRLPSKIFPGALVTTDLIFFRSRGGKLVAVDDADTTILEGKYFEETPSHVLGAVATGGRYGGGYEIKGEFAALPDFKERPLCDTCVHEVLLPAKAPVPKPKSVAAALKQGSERLQIASSLGRRLSGVLAGIAAGESEVPFLAWGELHQSLVDWAEQHGPPSEDADLQNLATKGQDEGAQKFLTAYDRGSTELVPVLRERPVYSPRYRGPKDDPVAKAEFLYRQQRRLPVQQLMADVPRLFAAGWAEDPVGELVPPDVYYTGDLWPKYDRAKQRGDQGDAQAAAQAARLLDFIKPSTFEDIAKDAFSPQQAWIPIELIECWIETQAKVGTVRLERKEGLVQIVGKAYHEIEGGWHDDVGQIIGWINHDRSIFKPRKSQNENIDEKRLLQADEWNKSFKAYCAASEGRKQIIEQTYQRLFQGYRPPKYTDEPLPLARWGKRVTLRFYQNAGARRVIDHHGGLCAFDVGLGKTFTGCAILAAARQGGWARRPVILVPNSLVWNWVRELSQALPDYRVGIIGADRKMVAKTGKYRSFTDTPEERAEKWTRFQWGEFDVMLVTYSSFVRTKMSPDSIIKYVEATSAIERHLALRRRNALKYPKRGKKGKEKETEGKIKVGGQVEETSPESGEEEDETSQPMPRGRRGRGSAKPKKEKKVITLTDLERVKITESTAGWVAGKLQLPEKWAYDPGITWDEIGVDLLIVDEAQNFKNLYLPSQREHGIPKFMGSEGEGSNRSWQLDFRAMTVRQRTGGSGVVLLSATPAKNSPLEFYNLLQYVDHEAFSRQGIMDPEQFIDRYCRLETQAVVDMIGNAKEVSACVGFMNLHELRETIFRYGEFKTGGDVEKAGAPARHAAWLELADVYGATEQEIARVWGWNPKSVKEGLLAARGLVLEKRPDDALTPVMDIEAEEERKPRLKGPQRKVALAAKKLPDGRTWLQVLEGVCDRMGYPLELGLDEGLKLPVARPRTIQLDGDDAQDLRRKELVKEIEEAIQVGGSPLGVLTIMGLVGIHANLGDRREKGIDEETGEMEYEPFWEWNNAENIGSPHSPKFDTCAANIRGRPDCGHIVFVESIAAHIWLKMVLVEKGIPKERIAILNAHKDNPDNTADARQRIADDFNGSPEETFTDAAGIVVTMEAKEPKYDVIIANQVAYEGINLQARTCAIHHLDLPWDPATLQQRNGRAWRQGNKFPELDILYYMSKCFPDSMKFTLIGGKAGWLADLIAGQLRDTNNPAAQMNIGREEMLAMISCDPEAARELAAKIEEKLKNDRNMKTALDASAKLRVANFQFSMARQIEQGMPEAEAPVEEEPTEPEEEEDEENEEREPKPKTPAYDRCGNVPREIESGASAAARFRAEGETRLSDLMHVDPEAWPWAEWALAAREFPFLVHVPEPKILQVSVEKRVKSKGKILVEEKLKNVKVYETPVSPVYETLRTKTPDIRDGSVFNYDEFGKPFEGKHIGRRSAGDVHWQQFDIDDLRAIRLKPEYRVVDPNDWPRDDEARMAAKMKDIVPLFARTRGSSAYGYQGPIVSGKHIYNAEEAWRLMNWVAAPDPWVEAMWGRYGSAITSHVNQIDERLGHVADKIDIPCLVRGVLVIGVKRRVDSTLPPTQAGYREFLRLAVVSDERFDAVKRAARYWWNKGVPNNLYAGSTPEEKARRAAQEKLRAQRERAEAEAKLREEQERRERERREEEERERERRERVAREEREREERREREREQRRAARRVEIEERAEREREELARNPHATLRIVTSATRSPTVREQLTNIGGRMGSWERDRDGNKIWPWFVPLAKADEARRIVGED